MKKILMGMVAIALVALVGSAMAADTAQVSVSASVSGNCKFNSGGTITFTLDPASTNPATGTIAQPEFWCTKGTPYTITDNFGVYEAVPNTAPRRMKHATLTEYIPYSFTYKPDGTGTGKTIPITMDISSDVANADFVNASAGSYADTVILTITN